MRFILSFAIGIESDKFNDLFYTRHPPYIDLYIDIQEGGRGLGGVPRMGGGGAWR